MPEMLSLVSIALLLVAIGLLLALLTRTRREDLAPAVDQLLHGQERAERQLREEMARSREEAANSAKQIREEVARTVTGLGDSVVKSVGELGTQQKNQMDSFATQLSSLGQATEERLNALREAVDKRLQHIQEDNSKRLDEMRKTVDERLEATLEKRLGESFKQVSERLEAVHKGLGEMQNLAAGVGDLKRVLTNVSTRGAWGEVQLATLLEQILTPDQYETNACCKIGSAERVEFAIRLPGRDGPEGDVVYLPIDSKFPIEDYQRLVDAQRDGNAAGVEAAAKQLEVRVKAAAKDIQKKYLNPPRTTDFGIMFLPTEGLYAEVLRRPGLADGLQCDCRVIVAGPTTLAALLNSLQMGFRTLAVEKRSTEVWQLLGAVKTQFGQFGTMLEKVHKKLGQASDTIEDATRKTRTIQSKLRGVEELPSDSARALIDLAGGSDADDEDSVTCLTAAGQAVALTPDEGVEQGPRD
jgi:DNA recombination protein RmuC